MLTATRRRLIAPGQAFAETVKPGQMTPIRALIVDDSARMRRAISDVLQTADACSVVGEAENGRQALELARGLRPDLIVLDVNMPVMGGMDALRLLRGDLPGAAVVMVSSDLLPEIRDHALRLGAVACLQKGDALANALLAVVAAMAERPLFGSARP